ncbi:MAG: hypothetical protein WAO91_00410 [Candidatus Nitrosotenuis sp.]
MSFPKAEVIYELNTEQFTPAASTAERALQTVENASKKTAREIENTERRVSFSTKQMATSLIGLGTAAFSAYQGIDQLEKVQLRAEKAALAVARAQKQVNDLEREGKQGTEAHTIAVERLRIAQEQASQAAGDVKQQTVQLGLSLATTGSMMATNIIALRSMTVAHSTAAGAATAQTAANMGLTFSFRGLTAAMMSNPLGLALVAASVGALAIYSTNLGGIKDKVDGLIGSFGGATPPISDFHEELKSQGIPAMQTYGGTVAAVGASADYTTQRVTNLGNSIDTIGPKIENLKKNEDSLVGLLGETAQYVGSLSSLADILNDQALKQRVIEFERAFEKATEERNRKFLEERFPGRFGVGFKDAVSDLQSSFSARGFSTAQQKYARYFSSLITEAFRDIRATGSLHTEGLHGSGVLGMQGIGESWRALAAFTPLSRLNRTNLGGRIGVTANSLGGISVSSGARGKSAKHGGNKGGLGAIAGNAVFAGLGGRLTGRNASLGIEAGRQAYENMASQLAEFGLSMPSTVTWIAGRGNVRGLAISNPNFQAEYDRVMAIYNQKKAAQLAQQMSAATAAGVSHSEYLSMIQTEQGMVDLSGMTLYKQLASLG